ncbi:MAG TPA: hypothetical protein DD671_14400 [Balneolaceae bacterium]|nr:hypothetical protein [Balneola sp.]HBQ60767.1 hypothetical protein [Balneolaceae bacterium]|tara:strand:- start:3628 stop:3846 length:219 start_codon:yes stop_codon:yes gene_type:complete
MNDRVKEDLVEWISKPRNEDLLESLKLMKEAEGSEDWFDDLTEKDKESIKRGLQDLDEERVLSSKEFWKKHG